MNDVVVASYRNGAGQLTRVVLRGQTAVDRFLDSVGVNVKVWAFKKETA